MRRRGVAILLALLVACAGACRPGATTHRHEEARFAVEADVEAGSLDVSVEPRPPYKLAIEFPFELRLGGPSGTRHDADSASDRSEKRLHYAVPAAGIRDVTVVFGICRGDDSICERVEHAFTLGGA